MDLITTFKKLIKNNTLSHAYLLWGYGTSDEHLEAAMNIVGLFEERPFVDCLVMCPLDGTIGINSVREAVRFIWQRPVRAERKILVVAGADALTTEAQNAILKTVEEPPQHGLILFVMRDPSLLVPALQSRFQKIYMPAGNSKPETRNSKHDLVHTFLRGTATERKDLVKNIIEEDEVVFVEFITGLIAELDKNPLKNYHVLKELLRRWTLMSQFSTNRRLQLEAVAVYL